MQNVLQYGLCFALLHWATFHVSAQTVEQWTAWGDASMERGEYYGASRFYAGALGMEPGRMNLQWKQAEAARLSNQYTLAAQLYDRVYSKDMGRTYPDALRWLGEMQLCDAAYADAARTWKKVLQKEKNESSINVVRARNALIGCELAGLPEADSISMEHLPAPVNTYASEFAARFGPDSAMYFSSLRGDLDDDEAVIDTTAYTTGIYSTRKRGAVWEDPMKEEAPPDAMGREHANLVWSADGSRMYFTHVDDDGHRSIHTRTASSPGVPLKGLEPESNTTQPWPTQLNGRAVLLFSSDRKDGEGGMDIWLGDLVGEEVRNIRNAGPLVNTPGNETCPSYDLNSATLWFSSDFHPGLGGYDIFRSPFAAEVFTAPINAGKSINSRANDLYPIYNSLTGEGWLTSNRVGSFSAKGETCCNDLYQFRSTVDRKPLAVTDPTTLPKEELPRPTALADLQELLPLKLYFHNDEPEPRSRATSTKQTYAVTYDAYKALFLTYIQENEPPGAIIDFFKDHAQAGRDRLDSLVKDLVIALNDGHSITLDVRGHASPLAQNDYNIDLSSRRIESLRMHLRSLNHGELQAYMDSTATNGAILRIIELPFGEDNSAAGVSDDPRDLKHSVYSVEAARERRIEVVRISTITKEREVDFDLGTVHQGVEQLFAFPITNESQVPLKIVESRSECDCTFGRVPEAPIPPGETVEMEIVYTGRARPGPLVRRIIVITDGVPERIILNVRGNVVE